MKWLRRTSKYTHTVSDYSYKFTLGRIYPAEVESKHYVIVCDNGNKYCLLRTETDSYYNWEVVNDDVD